MSEQESIVNYKVVVNHEEQYSIWPDDRENALGWQDAGFHGTKAESLAYIKEHWTDMRPLSLRNQMDQQQPVGNDTQPTASVLIDEGSRASDSAASPAVATAPAAVAVAEAPASVVTPPVSQPDVVPVAVAPQPSPDTTAPPADASTPKNKGGFFGRLFGGGKNK